MAFRHGVYTSEVPTSLISPVQGEAGLPVIVGTAPIHLASDEEAMKNVNKPKLIYTYEEAVRQFGFSRDWEKYTLCEFIYSQFALYGMSPCVLINVLDPTKHKERVSAREYAIVDGEVNLGAEVIISDGTFEAASLDVDDDFGDGDEPESKVVYRADVDYSLAYDDDGNTILTALTGGALAGKSKVYLTFTKLKPETVNSYDIIGGVDANTGDYSGFELVNAVFPKFRLIPRLLWSPKWSEKPEVAAVMRAKAENINGIFTGQAVEVDAPMTPRLIRRIVNSYNVRLNGLQAREMILGGRIEFLSSENPMTDLLSGILRFHIYFTPPMPSEQIVGIVELDPSYLETLFAA